MAEKERGNDNDDDVDEEDEEDSQRIEEERQAAKELYEEAEVRARAKKHTKIKNLDMARLWLTEDDLRSLDGSVKKNTAFQRKLRLLTEQQRASLTSDLKHLNLSKYIQEVACSIAEAKLKLADVGCAVHLCSMLHQRYADFSCLLMDNLQRMYQNPISREDDKAVVISKYRLGLRLTGELVLVGVVDEDLGLSLLQDMLSALITSNEEGHPYLAVMVSFARHFSEDLAGVIPRKQKMLFSKYNYESPLAALVPGSKQHEFLNQLRAYFSRVSSHLVKEHRGMHKRERRNHQLLTSKGEIPEERQAENKAAQKAYDKLLTSVSTLAELVDEDMPDLPKYVTPHEDSDISIELLFPSIGESDETDPTALWEDEDTRQFYEGITDIKPFIPALLLEERKKSASESTEDEETKPSDQVEELDDEKMLEQVIRETEEETTLENDEEEGKEGSGEGEGEKCPDSPDIEEEFVDPTSPGAQFERFAMRLPLMLNRKLVDGLAVEFCMSLNTKSSRKKLARAIFSVERNRMDLVPFYARLIATLVPCVDDVSSTLLEILLGDLRHQIRKKDQVHIHTKLKNIRLLAELTKFGVCPKPETMKCITLLLRDFTHHHVDMACLCIEQCGRFLLRSPDSHLRAKALLEILVRKKAVQHLDGRQRSLVESALYYANPPEVPQISVEVEPPMHLYVKKLLYKDLNKMNTEKILKQVRKLDWKDSIIFNFIVRCLGSIWNVKYSNIHCVANLLAGLKCYQEEAVIRVVDMVLEDIRACLEINLPKLNQRRVSCVKFVGELYNYQLIESNVVFKILYLMLQFGSNPDGTPTIMDPFDSYFRVRLVCILLDACGQYFDRGSTKRRLDNYFVYLQCYLFSKKQPQPLEVENLVRDTLETLRPHLVMYITPQEACEAALDLERKYKDKIGNYGHDELGEEEEEEEEELRESGHGKEEEEEEGEDDEDEEEEDVVATQGNIFEEEPILKASPALLKCQEDDAFVLAFEKMMNDDFLTRKSENLKVPNMDLAVPLHLKGPTREKALLDDHGESKIKFKVMTRRGHKQQLKELMIPVDSDLTLGLRDPQQQAKMVDYERVKQRTLDYERRQEEEDYLELVAEIENQLKPSKKQSSSSSYNSPLSRSQQQPQHYVGGRGGGGGGDGRRRRGGWSSGGGGGGWSSGGGGGGWGGGGSGGGGGGGQSHPASSYYGGRGSCHINRTTHGQQQGVGMGGANVGVGGASVGRGGGGGASRASNSATNRQK